VTNTENGTPTRAAAAAPRISEQLVTVPMRTLFDSFASTAAASGQGWSSLQRRTTSPPALSGMPTSTAESRSSDSYGA